MKRKQKKNKKSKKNYLICIILVLAIIVLLIVIKCFKKPTQTDVKTSALRLENTYSYTNELKVYIEPYSKGDYALCFPEEKDCGEEYLTIKTESNQTYIIENYKDKYFFYADGEKVKVHDNSENKTYVIDKLKPSYNFDFVIDNNDTLIGIVYSEELNEHTNYLLIDGNQVLYKNKYDYIISVSPKYLSASKYGKDGSQTGAYIINANKEEKPLISKEFKTDEYYGFFDLGNKYIIFEYGKKFELYDNDSLKLLYKSNKANLVDGNGYPRFLYSVDADNNIYIYDDKYLSILDSTGKEIKKSTEQIYGIDLIDKYIINTDNKLLTITDIDNKSYTITSLNNGDVDYYEYIEENNKKGILFDVYDKTLSYKDVYNSCKNNKCIGMSYEEFTKDYKDQLGYQYFFDYDTLKVTKTPTIISPIILNE